MKTKETTHKGEGQRRCRPVAAFEAGRSPRNKKGPGRRRNPLIRLEIGEGKPRIFFADFWPGFAG